jgi:hypothetical protein
VVVREGASLGARVVVVAGSVIGRWALLAAGAVVTRRVPEYALVAGLPARRRGCVGRASERLKAAGTGCGAARGQANSASRRVGPLLGWRADQGPLPSTETTARPARASHQAEAKKAAF